jgi:glycosyltransferase involved in cell wall biosynthesis
MDISPSSTPLVSIILFCRNSAPTIRRALDSVLNSTYRNIEFIVQDGLSTDGTLDILRTYGDSINLVSEADDGSSDAFRRALVRCSGDIIGSCLSDEELLPDAIAAAVQYLERHPDHGAIIGNAIITDDKEKLSDRVVGAEFDLLDYLLGRDTPYFCACFFSRRALHEIGFFTDQILYEAFEFEIWCRLATEHRIGYLPRALAKYAAREEQLSNTPRAIMRHIEARIAVLHRLFACDGFFGDNRRLRDRFILAQYRMFYAHAISYGLSEITAWLEPRIAAFAASGGATEFARSWVAEQKARRVWLGFGNMFPPQLKSWILDNGFHRLIRAPFLFVAKLLQGTSASRGATDQAGAEMQAELATRHDLAMIYASRGQIEEALDQWRRAEPLNDATIDSLACQAAQRAPSLTAAQIEEMQKRWAERHAPHPIVALPALGGNVATDAPLRVAYHCAWWDSTTARHQLLNFIARHDRSKVQPFCYSPIPVPHDIAQHFDTVRITGRLSDEEFVRQARSDRLDVFVETTGFSPDHRYAAMARRCAPVQISYLNHHATTGVPNVDYVLADAFLAAGEDRSYFTERIYPLPGCFFCFDLRDERLPYATEPPCKAKGFVTFGCFGSASKFTLPLIALWSAVLQAVPAALLFLRSRELTPADSRRFLLRRFARFGITADRLRIMGGTDHATILQNYAEIDISLDTWPYCGGNTIVESFWQGVPVITLAGDRFSARYGASLVRAHGCPELVAESKDGYVRIAADLAHNPDRLADYRSRMRDLTSRSGFNDSVRFARDVEKAYLHMTNRLS